MRLSVVEKVIEVVPRDVANVVEVNSVDVVVAGDVVDDVVDVAMNLGQDPVGDRVSASVAGRRFERAVEDGGEQRE